MKASNLATIIIAMCTLSACATNTKIAEQSQVVLQGKSKETILACMGVPDRQANAGEVEVWSYDSSSFGVVSVTSGTGGGGSGISCTANFSFKNGIVESLKFQGLSGSFMDELWACGPLVESCVD